MFKSQHSITEGHQPGSLCQQSDISLNTAAIHSTPRTLTDDISPHVLTQSNHSTIVQICNSVKSHPPHPHLTAQL